MRDHIVFLRRGETIELRPTNPTQTVLDYLRLDEKSKGTKEGCNEGDCGTCTIAIGRVKNGKLVYEPANACILLIGQLHGCELVTVDDLARDGILHPVQTAMVEHHGSQCGFCTPGFIMALFTLYHSGMRPTRQDIVDHIAGNLCRCTGYRPIIDAALAVCTGSALDNWKKNEAQTIASLNTIGTTNDILVEIDEGFIAIPATVASLTQIATKNPDATIVGGATDVGLWVTKQMRVLPKIIHTFNVAELHSIGESSKELKIGAAATYAEAFDALAKIDDDVGEVLRRLGSKHVRASGTIGGNIANGSPIGDMPPMLIALDAKIELQHGEAKRELPIEKFFIGYGKQDRAAGEVLCSITIPKLVMGEFFRAYKISKRFDQDISALLFALKIKRSGARIISARLAMGGMAATPKRAPKVEAELLQVDLANEATWSQAVNALAEDYQPISDMRASAQYRIETAKALLHKALIEISNSSNTRVIGKREVAA